MPHACSRLPAGQAATAPHSMSTVMTASGSTSPASRISSAAPARFSPTWRQHFARLGFTARIALAETLGGAHALARYAHSSSIIVPQGKIGEALAPLPVEALRLDGDITRLLKRLGLKRIGQLYDLPRPSLERRFHSRQAAEAVLHRLDQALGQREEPRNPAPSRTRLRGEAALPRASDHP